MKKILIPGLVVGLLILIVGMVVGQIFTIISPSLEIEYENANLFRPWSDPLMSIYFAYPFILGIVLAWIWDKTKVLIEESNLWKRGTYFGFAYWLVTIPGMIITYSSFPVSLLMVISWSISVLLQAVCAGIIYARLNK
jgi:hypothetical protein